MAYNPYDLRRNAAAQQAQTRKEVWEEQKPNVLKQAQQEAQRQKVLDLLSRNMSSGAPSAQDQREMRLTEAVRLENQTKRQYEDYARSEAGRAEAQEAQRLQNQLAFSSGGSITFPMGALAQGEKTLERKAKADYFEQNRKAVQDRNTMEKDLEEVARMDEADRKLLETYTSGRNEWFDHQKIADSVSAWAELEKKYGKQKVEELAESWQRYQNALSAERTRQEAQEAGDGWLAGTVHSAASVAANAVNNLSAPLGYLQEAFGRTGRYQTLDPNNAGAMAGVYASAAREAVAEDMGAVGKVLYQGTMGAMDNLARIGMGGGTKFGSLGLAALGSFGSTLSEASAQGATPGQAIGKAVLSSGIEVATEYVPLDELFKAGKGGYKGAKAAFKQALKQGGIEAAEEEISLLGNVLVDALVLREKSSYNQQIGELVANGMSYKDAKAQADRALWDEAVNTAVTSFVSGGVMSGAQSGGQYVGQKLAERQQMRNELAGHIQSMMQKETVGAEKAPAEKPTADDYIDAMAEGLEYHDAALEQYRAQAPADDGTQEVFNELVGVDQAQVSGVQMPIQKDMPEQERYEALKDKKVVAVTDTDSANYPQEMNSLAALKAKAKSQAEKIIKPLAKKLGILNRNMKTPDLEVEFQFSGGGLNESMAKQLHYGGSYADFGRAMVNLDKVLKNAVLVEQHGDKYKGTIRENRNLENVSVLFGAFRDGDSIIPMQMEIKKASDTGSRLYMTVTMTKIEADVKGKTVDPGQAPSLLSASEYNIADIFREINPQDAHFLKYVPDSFLTDEQASAKQRALAEDAAKIQRYKETGRRSDSSQNAPQGAEEGFEAMGAADYNFSPYTRMQNEYGNIPEGENPVRPDDAPISTDGNDRVSYTARTAIGAQVTPDEFVPLIENEVVRGGFSFIPITNDQTTQNAVQTIQTEGWERALRNWTAQVQQGSAGADITAVGALLYNHAVNSGDYETAMDILTDYSMAVRNSAQGLQAARILKRLTPENRLYMIRRSVQRMVEDMHLDRKITIDEDLARRYQETRDDAEADRILDEIARDVAQQIPATLGERITALRYLNMLGNFRTQVRNIAGNLGAKATYLIKDELAATIEGLASLASGGRFQRSKVNWVDRTTRNAARADYENVADWISGGGRANDRGTESDDFARRVQENRRILPAGLEQYRRATNWAMNNRYFGDAAFGREAYARALAGYLNARGIRTDNLNAVDRDTLNQAREYAVRQAQEATFRDNNWLSTAVSRAARRNDTPWALRVLGEAIMPFRKTPANVLVRAEEFSPLGLINSAVNTVRAARGDITGAELVESWAKTLTGTGLFAIGWALSNMGYLRGGPDEDEEKAAFDQLNGYQDYALVLPDGTNLTIDFLSPAAMPMLLGAQFDKIMNDTDITWADLDGVFLTLSDPMIEMSMLQGINDTFDAIRYADNSLAQFAVNAMTNYLTQALGNTLIGQVERSTEESRMTTYVDKDSNVPAWLQRNLGKLSQKVPGWDYQQTEYIDQWGKEQKNPEGIKNWLYQLLSPSYIDKGNVDAVAEELYRLNEAQTGVNVFPQSPEAQISYTDKNGNKQEKYNLSMEELDKLKRTEGQTQAKLVADLIGTRDYEFLTDAQKAKAVSLAYDYARELARGEVLPGYDGMDAWMQGIQGKEAAAIVQQVAGSGVESALKEVNQAIEDGKSLSSDARMGFINAVAEYEKMSSATKAAVAENAGGALKRYIEAKEKGVGAADFLSLYEASVKTGSYRNFDLVTEGEMSVSSANAIVWMLEGITGTGAENAETGERYIRDIDRVQAIADGKGITDEETETAIRLLVLDDKQEEKLDNVLDLGYGIDDYADFYQVQVDNSKKAEFIATLQEMGLSNGAATELYYAFNPKK